MMNKIAKKGVIGVACACALALTCGTAAFAEPGAGVGSPGNFTDSKADSTLSVKTDATQLAATVPLSVTVVADTQGGAFMGVPSPDTYKITNKSYFDITVSNIKATALSDWEYSNVALDGTTTTSAGIGKINLTLKPFAAAKPTMVQGGEGAKPSISSDWTVSAATGADAPGALNLTVGGSTSALKKSLGDVGSEAVTVTYTIAPAAA